MARKIYIAHGPTVDAGWTRMIAVSYDNVNWEAINKGQLTVHPIYRQRKAPIPAANNNGADNISTIIVLRDTFGETALKFECDNVVNQVGWQGKTKAALRQAVDDITTWISTP